MEDYISDTLVHWTGRNNETEAAFNNLKSIVSTRLLYLSYCPNFGTPEGLRTTRDNLNDRKTMMVCFTDLPLKYSKTFCDKFGKFGIGFKKDKMIEYGANPVLYTTNKHLPRVRQLNSLVNKLQSEEVDREWRSQGDRYQFTTEQFYTLFEIFGLTQEYSYRDRDVNYYQREWRINYDTLPNARRGGAETPGYGGIKGLVNGKIMCEMMFAPEDVDYVIIPKQFYSRSNELVGLRKDQILIYENVVEGRWWRKLLGLN